jgi:hypothetical protein
LRLSLLDQYPQGFSFAINYKPDNSEKSSTDEEITSVCSNIQKNINSSVINAPSPNINQIFIRKNGDFPTQISQMLCSDYIEVKTEWFKPIIAAKTKKQKNWNDSYDCKWLLISIGLSRSGEINLKEIEHLQELRSAYWDKIILIDINFADYIEINAA